MSFISAKLQIFKKLQFLGICVDKTDHLWNDGVITNLFPSQVFKYWFCFVALLRVSYRLTRHLTFLNTWLRWNGSLVRLKKIHFWFHTRNQPWSAGWRSCVWPTTQPLLTRSSHPSWDFVALLDPPVALISYFLGCVYIGETLKPKVKSSFCVFTTERLYLRTREWEQDVRARCWFM